MVLIFGFVLRGALADRVQQRNGKRSSQGGAGGELASYREEVILKGVSGYMLPGQTHYIMGASGAGKTTLLNALSGRIRLDRFSSLKGEMKLNDCVDLNQ